MRFSTLFGVGLLAASLTGPARALAQIPCPPAGIRTDPANPADPSGKINTFNWYYGNYQPAVYNGRMYTLNSPLPGVGQPYIDLPWLQPYNAVMDRFQGHIDTPGDGWELIRRDLGYFDSGAPAQTTNPLLILYNRRTSVLRVFTAVGDAQNNFQFAEVKLKFGAAINKAATLNRMSALGVALEDTEPRTNPEMVAAARYLNSRSRWFVADFPMDYDPCICQFDSRLDIRVNLITQADVKLMGKTTGTLVSMKDGGTGSATGLAGPDMDKGIPFIRKANSVLEAGGKSYDNIDKFTTKMSDLFPGKAASLKSLSDASKLGSFMKTGLGALPYVGAAMSMLDYFMGGGQDAGPQSVVMQPMTIEMSTTTTGTISTNNWYTSSTFNNPGNRKPDPVPEKMPFYNEAMGVFSLLKRPTVQTQFTQTLLADRTYRLNFKYRLAEDLSYVVNPASGLEVQDFQVALVSEALNPNTTAPSGFTSTESPIVHPTLDANGQPTYDATGQPIYVSNNAYRTNYYDAACIKNQMFNITTSSDPSAANYYRTKSLTLKVMVNLRPVGGSSTVQNVLFVARYPVNTFDVGDTFPVIPTAACGVLPQASNDAINAVCQGTKYKQAIVLARPVRTTTVQAGPHQPAGNTSLQAFPNPATGLVRLSYHVTQPGHVRLTLSDALGREVRTVLDQEQAAAGTFEATAVLSGLRAGIYFCTMHTATQHVVERLVVTD